MDMARYHIPQPHCGAATASTNHTVAAPLPLLPLLVVPLLPLLPLLFVRSLPLLPVTSKRMVSAPYATRSSPEPSRTRPAARSGRRCSQGIHWDGRPVDRRECLDMAAHPAQKLSFATIRRQQRMLPELRAAAMACDGPSHRLLH